MPKGRHEVAGKEEDHEGLWSRRQSLCFKNGVKMFYATIPKDWYEVVGKGLTMKGYGQKRRSFGEINKMVILRENLLKETSYLFQQRCIFVKKF